MQCELAACSLVEQGGAHGSAWGSAHSAVSPVRHCTQVAPPVTTPVHTSQSRPYRQIGSKQFGGGWRWIGDRPPPLLHHPAAHKRMARRSASSSQGGGSGGAARRWVAPLLLALGAALAAWGAGPQYRVLPADQATQALLEWAVARGASLVRGRPPVHDTNPRSGSGTCKPRNPPALSRRPTPPPPPPPPSQPGAVVGRACPTCPRGVFASKDLKAGDVVMRVPLSLALELTVRCAL